MLYEKSTGEIIETNCMMGLPGIKGNWSGSVRDLQRGCKCGRSCPTCGFDEHVYAQRIADIRENGLTDRWYGCRGYIVRQKKSVQEKIPAP